MLALRLFVWLAIGVAAAGYFAREAQTPQVVEGVRDAHLRQFENDDAVPQAIRQDKWQRDNLYGGVAAGWIVLGLLLFSPELVRYSKFGR